MRLRRAAYQPGHFYHIYNRGAHRLPIFREPENYLFVIQRLKKYSRQYNLTVIAYCLLPNHYHLLIRQDDKHPASLLPQYTFNSYSKAYNRRYHHSGTLFEGNFKAKPVQDEAYLLTLCRYIHTNPVKHGLVSQIEAWPYSNYPEWIQARPGSLVDLSFVQAYYPTPADYQAEIEAHPFARGQSHEFANDLWDPPTP